MQDPVGSFIRIRELFLSYLDTAFRIGDESVATERRRLLREPGSLCTDPLLEPLPKYESASTRLEQLVVPPTDGPDPLEGFTPEERRAFIELAASGLFDSVKASASSPTSRSTIYSPFRHQMEMLARGVRAGAPGIVTSGTGSGKTESFLLPILATIAKEAAGWPDQSEEYLCRPWWHDPTTGKPWSGTGTNGEPVVKYTAIPRNTRPTQRSPLASPFELHRKGEAEGRPAAVRALLLYPMNALVEDQMVRLRKALDSREARETMDREFHRNRIFFGRYTGATPVTGHHAHPGLEALLRLPSSSPELDAQNLVRLPSHKDADRTTGLVPLKSVREREVKRRQRRLGDLFTEMVAFEEGQIEARLHAAELAPEQAVAEPGSEAATIEGDDAPFMFPSVDGGELCSRWDMQETPPDILITNVSMLSAMLTREVEAPIFETTRAWLEEDDDAYFFLVLDELHLQRGAAGTEVCYLIRLLLQRLGLDRPELRHKLRVLASSASLPNEPEKQAKASGKYLWDMFGSHGLATIPEDAEAGAAAWVDSLVPGKQVEIAGPGALQEPLPSANLEALLEFNKTLSGESPPDAVWADTQFLEVWKRIVSDLGLEWDDDRLGKSLHRCISGIAARLAAVCWDPKENRSRAVPLRQAAVVLFKDLEAAAEEAGRPLHEQQLILMRALLLARGMGDALPDRLGGRVDAPSFRLHTFFKSIEGLYAPALKGACVDDAALVESRRVPVGRLGIQREGSLEHRTEAGTERLRLLELLYCEACGELFFGGMRPRVTGGGGKNYLAELLPHEPELEGLPDEGLSQNFEELTREAYALFWPNEDLPNAPTGWVQGSLDPRSGVIWRRGRLPTGTVEIPDTRPGFLFESDGRRSDREQSHVPRSCPNCQTDYSGRTRGRLSPIRNFRTGFAKTTQLLATELFDALRVAMAPGQDPKLVSFSDSRQDAAKGALDIERNHHQDLRRDLLLLSLDAVKQERSKALVDGNTPIEEMKRRQADAMQAGVVEDVVALQKEITTAQEALERSASKRVAMTDVLESYQSTEDLEGHSVSPLLAGLIGMGVHPYDDAGIDRVPASTLSGDRDKQLLEWPEVFETVEAGMTWHGDMPNLVVSTARQHLLRELHARMTDVIFSKTYFALEESGLAFATTPNSVADDPEQGDELAALMRILTDMYRYTPTLFDPKPPWTAFSATNTRFRKFIQAAWGDQDSRSRLEAAKNLLHSDGHKDLIVSVKDLAFHLTEARDPFWRCDSCARVHLHRGLGICTRCTMPLPDDVSGNVEELWESNFLSRRVRRARILATTESARTPAFRLHCEELTGQTTDPARRQREFRGIFVPKRVFTNRDRDSEPEFELVHQGHRLRDEIDLMTVTTTMEVGVDIGALQAVLQANMPPQRFNYQQRVGRAGRRGQAFSMALTICRTKSHDTYYFDRPERITGDIPPTPFLTKDLSLIPERFIRKQWLAAAFGRLRQDAREAGATPFPGDVMSPPDIHGEFMTVAEFVDPELSWASRLKSALSQTASMAEEIRDSLLRDARTKVGASIQDTSALIDQLDEINTTEPHKGLAHALADHGLLPMYGMPTRTRMLYLGIDWSEKPPVPRTIDRDLDLAIYEFAPGSVLVKDKREHRCIGFTPDFGIPAGRRGRERVANLFADHAFGERFQLEQCATCGAWSRVGGHDMMTDEKCASCSSLLHRENAHTCVVPNGFRTDFRPDHDQEDSKSGVRHRSIQAESSLLAFTQCPVPGPAGSRRSLELSIDGQARTFRLNRGPTDDQGIVGFQVVEAEDRPTRRRDVVLGSQVVEQRYSDRVTQAAGAQETVWLAAPKTTDTLSLRPAHIDTRFALHRLPARTDNQDPIQAMRWQGVRAAALSASFLLAGRAAFHLDIDPGELVVLEPRPYGTLDRRPILQLADDLVNGAGYCRRLGESSEDGSSIVAQLVASLLDEEKQQEPMDVILEEGHRQRCDAACYRCLLRYGNQPYHGLLDWRLGLDYLRILVDPDFACGLDGKLETASLEDWLRLSGETTTMMANRFGSETRWLADGRIPSIRLEYPDVGDLWVLIAHPLWDWGDDALTNSTILKRAYDELVADVDSPVTCWDSFNLARRAVAVREQCRTYLQQNA